ncbi:adenine nucleotide alpha hydrolase family protein [Marinobacter salarius]|uniref:Phosphoadenosine phosphosulphate reductase domain-containing protein n=1 Tax=Marinobacter salarius TaxID=1420917 RepID=A0A1W6KFL2_9GAMM|nr:hypothetical protein [Marinobacter salarius]ARM86112.1 hypothetical protein MARSALSMR5_04092 [Marinobacter salarius]
MDNNQAELFNVDQAPDPREAYTIEPLLSYDHYIVGFSGGKDSIASVLELLEAGVPADKIELWHHRIDGARSEKRVFDWPVTDAYIESFARAMKIELYWSWKEAGIHGEMMRKNELTAPTSFEDQNRIIVTTGGTRGELATRRMFPGMPMKNRFCSSYGKIDVCAKSITGQTRFCNAKTLFISGERWAESTNRSKLARAERHRTDRREGRLNRLVDHYRPVIDFSEQDIWDSLKRWGIRPHPAYEIIGRVSCAYCIFGSPNQFATLRVIDPAGFTQMTDIETEIGHTMKSGRTLNEVADYGKPLVEADSEAAKLVMDVDYALPILMDPKDWVLPAGAFGENVGP